MSTSITLDHHSAHTSIIHPTFEDTNSCSGLPALSKAMPSGSGNAAKSSERRERGSHSSSDRSSKSDKDSRNFKEPSSDQPGKPKSQSRQASSSSGDSSGTPKNANPAFEPSVLPQGSSKGQKESARASDPTYELLQPLEEMDIGGSSGLPLHPSAPGSGYVSPSLTFGTPTALDDPGHPRAIAIRPRQKPPMVWGDWPDSFDRYEGHLFPKPRLDDWTGNEKRDFYNSMRDWFDRRKPGGGKYDGTELDAESNGPITYYWHRRVNEKTQFWNVKGAPYGTRLVEPGELGGDQEPVVPRMAFPVDMAEINRMLKAQISYGESSESEVSLTMTFAGASKKQQKQAKK